MLQKERPLTIEDKNQKRSQRQKELRRIDAWLDRLYSEHPVLHWLLAIGIAIGVLAIAMLLKWLFTISLQEREVWMSKDAFKQSGSSPTQPDFVVENHGSIFLLTPLSPPAKTWVNEHIGSENGFQPYWPTVVIEHRYISDIVQGIRNDGLAVA